MKKHKQSGFTLIELMIVVAVIGILAGIGYPMYTKQILRGNRSEGRAYLMDSAARLERFYSNNSAYATATNTVPAAGANISLTSTTGRYGLTITTATPFQTYTLTATPATFVDPDCGNLTLTQAGVKGRTGASAVNDCWGR